MIVFRFRFIVIQIIILIVIITSFSNLCAQSSGEGLIEVQSQVDTAVITIGDRINYTIIINRDKNLRIEKPGEGLNLGMFEIKDYKFHKPETEGNRIIERFDFNISVYDTGKFTIPAFPIAYFLSDTSRSFHLTEAAPIDIYVKSVIRGDEARELKDVKPPLVVPFNYTFWVSIGVVLLLLAAIAYFGYRLYFKRKEKGYLFTPPPLVRPAHEVALEALEKLYQSDLLVKGAFKAFFIELSQIVRVYIEGRYFISAMEETTFEIMRDIKSALDDENLRSDLKNILTLSDLVKFAKYIPIDGEVEQAKQQALDFVNSTKLVFNEEINTPATAIGVPEETAVPTN